MAKQFLPYNDKSYEFPDFDNATLIEYGIHDTFDALTSTFDIPIDRKTAISWLEEAGFKEFDGLDRNIILIRAIR